LFAIEQDSQDYLRRVNEMTAEREGYPSYYLTDPYRTWRASQHVPVHEGFGFDCTTVDLSDWPRLGGRGAFLDVAGRGDFCDMYVVEIPPGGKLAPERQLSEKMVYVVRGHGLTTLSGADGVKQSFEWNEGSLFAVPINMLHQFANGSGKESARLAVVTDLPLMLNTFHDMAFIFENDFDFAGRIADPRYLSGEGDYMPVRPGRNQWQSLLVPDLRSVELPAFEARGAGSKHLHFILGDASMHAHTAEMPRGRYKKAHRHPAGYHVFCVTGRGYSLLWLEGQSMADAVRMDWTPGCVYAPPDEYYHQHFNVADEPSRYLALGFGSVRHPVLDRYRRVYEMLGVNVEQGGDQIEHEDEWPDVYDLFARELQRAGSTLVMERPSYRTAGLAAAPLPHARA
jgi:quercetin dioxygenase-like cupin family protein